MNEQGNAILYNGSTEPKIVKSFKKARSKDCAALQVIILGSGGGPMEDNTTAFLVRSIESEWKRGSVLAVDAGVHLGAIAKILAPYMASMEAEDSTSDSAASDSTTVYTLNDGPFKGFELLHRSASANAAQITRDMVDTYLITHPHLDHISGMVVGTASLGSSNRAKRIAGLPSTIEAFKNHIFNDIIWPNLSDENGGPGLINYLKLTDGGSLALGSGMDAGYFEVTEGLSVRTRSVSHGHSLEKHPHHRNNTTTDTHIYSRLSHDYRNSSMSPILLPTPKRLSLGPTSMHSPLIHGMDASPCPVNSSAYFIRDIATKREVLIFGDVEPDILSSHPRNRQVWEDAAPLVATGNLRTILIECSYTDDRPDNLLFGHLCPRHLIQELRVLADLVDVVGINPHETPSTIGNKRRKMRANGDELHNQVLDATTHKRKSILPTSSSSRPNLIRAASSSISPSMKSVTSLSSDYFDIPVTPLSFEGLKTAASFTPLLTDSTNIFKGQATISKGSADARSPSATYKHPSPSSVDTPRPVTRSSYRGVTSEAQALRSPDTLMKKTLSGLKIVIVHVKDRLDDSADCGQTILEELKQHADRNQIGCEFVISFPGMSIEL